METVTNGRRRFMAACRKEEVSAGRYHQEERETTRLGKFFVAQQKHIILRSDIHWPSRRAEIIPYGRETGRDLRSA